MNLLYCSFSCDSAHFASAADQVFDDLQLCASEGLMVRGKNTSFHLNSALQQLFAVCLHELNDEVLKGDTPELQRLNKASNNCDAVRSQHYQIRPLTALLTFLFRTLKE